MGKETVEALIEGGKATAAPPLGSSLGPLGVDIGAIVDEINKKTSNFSGIEVPVKVIVDTDTKNFEIEVGTPSVSAMIKKELKIEKLQSVDDEGKRQNAGDISFEAVKKIAESKSDDLQGEMPSKVSQVLGTCLSVGITVDGKNPKDIQKEIKENKIKI